MGTKNWSNVLIKSQNRLNYLICFVIFFITSSTQQLLSQNPPGFEQMVDNTIPGKTKLAYPAELNYLMQAGKEPIILDAREADECAVSHIATARCVGYDDFDLETVSDLPKDRPVYVYCSIGYRSDKIGQQLEKAGFERVFNLYGGIFSWSNNGYPLEGDDGLPTQAVHGFNKRWSKWLNVEKTEPVLTK